MAQVTMDMFIWTWHFWKIFPIVNVCIICLKNAFLTPFLGESRSDIIEKLMLLSAALLLSNLTMTRDYMEVHKGLLFITGIVWATGIFIFEILVRRYLFRERLFLILDSYKTRKGRIGIVLLVLISTIPIATILINSI